MRFRKHWLLVLTLGVSMTIGQKVFADLIGGVSLGAQNVVDAYNSLNGGKGFRFGYCWGAQDAPYQIYYKDVVSNTTNLEAYENQYPGSAMELISLGWAGYDLTRLFRTFCVEPETPGGGIGRNDVAKLNYSGSSTHVDPSGVALTVGAAYLYTQFSQDALLGIFPENTARDSAEKVIGNAIRYLMGYTSEVGQLNNQGWDNNVLQYLLTVNNDRDYWLGVYNPDAYYTEIGNYSVFVMNVWESNGTNSQDFLYLAKADIPYDPSVGGDVPEPAALLLWTLGGLGLVCSSRAHKRRMKRLAFA